MSRDKPQNELEDSTSGKRAVREIAVVDRFERPHAYDVTAGKKEAQRSVKRNKKDRCDEA